MARHVKILMKTINTQAQEAQAQETYKNYTIIKLLKTSEKEEIVKAAREKAHITWTEKQGKEKKNNRFFMGNNKSQ